MFVVRAIGVGLIIGGLTSFYPPITLLGACILLAGVLHDA